ncbi:MAG: hypothetical protein IT376_23595 [Polyangiaceae bacterium]|nr:hypothetical protein [Polyangiaceae bacterium]
MQPPSGTPKPPAAVPCIAPSTSSRPRRRHAEDHAACKASDGDYQGKTFNTNPTNKNNKPENKTMSNYNVQNNIVGPPPKPKKVITVLNGGAHRGARENMRAFVDFNLESSGAQVIPYYIDPAPGRALATQEEAEGRGIIARAIEGRIEDALVSGDIDATAPVVLNLDRASAVASALHAVENFNRAVLAYMMLKLPSGRLWAVRLALEPRDGVAREAAFAFFDRIAAVSERNASAGIFGTGADPAHALAEPAIRAWFAEHTRANLSKIAAGVEPVTNVFEATSDGQRTVGLHIVVRPSWSDTAALADEVVSNPTWPIRRGSQFVVAEVTPEGVRFHLVRRRSDERVTVHGTDTINRAAVEAQEKAQALAVARAAEQDAANARRSANTPMDQAEQKAAMVELVMVAAAALRRAERETLSTRNPVMTTD